MPADLALNREVAKLSREAGQQIRGIWSQVRDAQQAGEALNDLLPGIIDLYGTAAAGLAATWYDDLRDQNGIPGHFTADPADIADTGVGALVGWAQSEVADPTDLAAFRSLIEGGVQKRVANFSRLTVMDASYADPQAHGWQRVGNGANCPFCNMLIGRGAVYSEAGVSFGAHDHCDCGAQPAWGGLPLPVKAYTPTNRNITDADRARVRAWIAANQ